MSFDAYNFESNDNWFPHECKHYMVMNWDNASTLAEHIPGMTMQLATKAKTIVTLTYVHTSSINA